MSYFLTNGVGGTAGSTLSTAKPMMMSGKVWYVDSITGNASHSGLDRTQPFALISTAITAASAGDFIVCLSTHAESVTSAALAVNKQLTIIGEGSSSGQPTVTITRGCTSNDIDCMAVTADFCVIENIKFTTTTSGAIGETTGGSMINTTNAATIIRNCRFEMNKRCGSNSAGVELSNVAADHCVVQDCTFISTETSTTAGDNPFTAMIVTAAVDNLFLSGVTFDNGTVGFSGSADGYAFNASAALVRVRAENMRLLNGADMKLHASSTGYVNVASSTGGARVEW
jgi:hypothetical protein